MRLPFINNMSREQKDATQKIKSKVRTIIKKVTLGNLKDSDINELEKLYNEYFKKYPNPKSEEKCKERIIKLRRIA